MKAAGPVLIPRVAGPAPNLREEHVFTFKLTDRATGNVLDVEAGTGDIYFWEKTHKGKLLSSLQDNKSMVDFYELAHVAAKRAGVFDGSVDDLAGGYDLDADSDDGPDPTPAVP